MNMKRVYCIVRRMICVILCQYRKPEAFMFGGFFVKYYANISQRI